MSQLIIVLLPAAQAVPGNQDCQSSCNIKAVNENFCFNFLAALRKQHAAELHLGDFLVFLRRVVSSKAIQSKMASPKWTEVLLNIASQKCCSGMVMSKCAPWLLCISVVQSLLEHVLHGEFLVNSSNQLQCRCTGVTLWGTGGMEPEAGLKLK